MVTLRYVLKARGQDWEQVNDAVELLSVVLDRHFLSVGGTEDPSGFDTHRWQEADGEDWIEWVYWNRHQISWLWIATPSEEGGALLQQNLAEFVAFEYFAQVLPVYQTRPEDLDALRRTCLAALPQHQEEVQKVLTRSLIGTDADLRRAAGELVVLLKTPGLAQALAIAEEHEQDPNYLAAIRFARSVYPAA